MTTEIWPSCWPRAARIARFPFEIVECNVTNDALLSTALTDIDVVVHCARGKGDGNTVTVEGTRHLLKCAKAQGVKKFIFMSWAADFEILHTPWLAFPR